MKRLIHAASAWGLAAIVSTVPVRAQQVSLPATPPENRAAPPVEELVQIAVERAAEIEVTRDRLDAAAELVAPAGALPDTQSSVAYQEANVPRFGIGTEPMSAVTFEVRQGLLYPGKREARRAAARAEVDIRAKELAQVQAEVASEVRLLYARLYALDRERDALEAAAEMLDLLVATATSRYSVGEANQEPVLKAQLAITALGERQDDLAATRAGLAAALNRLLDRSPEVPLSDVEVLPAVSVPADRWEDLALDGSPALAVRQAEVAAAERRLDVARTETKPNLSLGGAVGVRGTLPPVVTVGLGIEWPLFKKDRQEPLIRSAQHEVDLARRAQHQDWIGVQTELARLSAEWKRAEQQIRRYQEAVLPQTIAVMEAARVAYLNGRGDFSAVIEDFNLWLDARVRLASREAERFAVWAALQVHLGGTTQSHSDGGR